MPSIRSLRLCILLPLVPIADAVTLIGIGSVLGIAWEL
jgi:hypothetical protein